MASRRAKRPSRQRTLLPFHSSQLSHSLSCWYCDFKITVFNEILYSLGRKYARFLRLWFTLGIGFSFAVLIASTMILLRESIGVLALHGGNVASRNLSMGKLFGLSPLVPGLHISITDTGYIIFSTLISIAFHEFGHAVAAASEGVPIEYIAVFLAIVFPGALVAFNHELVESRPSFSSLRIYCAGIWHNAMLCAVCRLALFLLPLILYPLYAWAENPVVLSVSPSSPLSAYLSRGDVIESLDGLPIHSPHDWFDKMAFSDDQAFQESRYSRSSQSHQAAYGRKGYCMPLSLIGQSLKIEPVDGLFPCPEQLTAFKSAACFNFSLVEDDLNNVVYNKTGNAVCLPANSVIKLGKCGDGWQRTEMGSNCPCVEEEECLLPVQMPDPDSRRNDCGGTFVYIGDVLSEAYSVGLTSYWPQWSLGLLAYFPNILEKLLAYMFHVSATLALLNSLPVFLLVGESILEVSAIFLVDKHTEAASSLTSMSFLWVFLIHPFMHFLFHHCKPPVATFSELCNILPLLLFEFLSQAYSL